MKCCSFQTNRTTFSLLAPPGGAKAVFFRPRSPPETLLEPPRDHLASRTRSGTPSGPKMMLPGTHFGAIWGKFSVLFRVALHCIFSRALRSGFRVHFASPRLPWSLSAHTAHMRILTTLPWILLFLQPSSAQLRSQKHASDDQTAESKHSTFSDKK